MHHSDGKRAKRQPSLVERLPRNAAIVVIFSTGLFLLVSYAKQARVQQQVMRKSEIRISKSETNEDENQNPKSEKTPSAAAQPSPPIGKSEIRNPKSETSENKKQSENGKELPDSKVVLCEHEIGDKKPSPPSGKSEIRNPKSETNENKKQSENGKELPDSKVVLGKSVPAPRSSLPSDAVQEEAGRLMDEIYKVSAAKTPEQKRTLANQLFKVAASQKVKPEERFVLLRKTTDLAAEGGDVTLVLNATRRAGEEFDFDFLASQEKALARIALGPMDAARVKALLTGASQGVEQALAAGRGEVALEFAGLARQVSQRKEGSEFRALATRLQAEIAKAAAQGQEISDARTALATSPDDAEANRSLGAYLCLEAGDWEHGLACLAKGGDGQIRAGRGRCGFAAERGCRTGRAWRPVVGSCAGAAGGRAGGGDASGAVLVREGPRRVGGRAGEGAGRVAVRGREGGRDVANDADG